VSVESGRMDLISPQEDFGVRTNCRGCSSIHAQPSPA